MPVNNMIATTRQHLGLGDIGAIAAEPPYKPSVATEGLFSDWIAVALVGQAIQYHEGFLLIDRSESHSSLPAKERARVHAVARRAWIACELGLVHLFSQRVSDHHYRYLAVRSGSTLTPPEIRTRLRKSGSTSTAALNPTTH